MKKRMLADVLWEAANERLWDGVGARGHQWSCAAAYAATLARDRWTSADVKAISPVHRFLTQLGCYPTGWHFEDVPIEQRQGVRYMWLLLAMHVAEDEGIEV